MTLSAARFAFEIAISFSTTLVAFYHHFLNSFFYSKYAFKKIFYDRFISLNMMLFSDLDFCAAAAVSAICNSLFVISLRNLPFRDDAHISII